MPGMYAIVILPILSLLRDTFRGRSVARERVRARRNWRLCSGTALTGAEVDVSLEIHLRVPEGVNHDVVRTVSENANVLGCKHGLFEPD